MAKMNNLRDVLHDQLMDLYDAEQQLKSGFEQHHRETQNQISRLERVFQAMGQQAQRKTCRAMRGLIEEGEEVMRENASNAAMDAALIAAAQRIEHYEIAGYGTARTMARMLGMREAADMLEQTLSEEEQTDKKLTQMAEQSINQKANTQSGMSR